MLEQPTDCRRVNWLECCPVTSIFRTFRMALHPSKLGLALAAVILTGLWGLLLDGIWSQKHQPLAGELNAFWQVSNLNDWRKEVRQRQVERLQLVYVQLGVAVPENLAARFEADPKSEIEEALDEIERKYAGRAKGADEQTKAEIARELNPVYFDVQALGPKGIFESFLHYEVSLLREILEAAATLNFTGGLREVALARQERPDPGSAMVTDANNIGVLPGLVLLARGKQWLITQHYWFFLPFALVSLAIWALFGGAIARLAAMNFARDERISPRAALDFARRKFVGFYTAPLLPVALIALVGIFLVALGLITAIPYIGEVIGGLAMILGLAGGFVIALVVIGLVAGSSLFYPTIAVEGSDSFDAISRSYAYIYSKPWRAIFYGLVALIYGSLTYLFARFFVLLMLKATRAFVEIGTLAAGSRPGTGRAGATKLDAMWASPTFDNLLRSPAPLGQVHWEPFGSFLIGLWVLLVVLLLCSFLVSFYVTASTIIYYLLRRDVDATDIEEVYVEGEQEEATTAAPAAPPPAAPPPPIPPAPETPLA